MDDNLNRRELSTRKVQFFHRLAKRLVALGLHPNHVSLLSMLFAGLGGASYILAGMSDGANFWFVLAIVGIQFRLLCNLIDGLMAVEGGLKTATGELYNDVPDSISDMILFISFGLATHTGLTAILGFIAALGAIMTAYIRVLGASMGAGHFFSGPMAKQHRMFLLTLATLIWAAENYFAHSNYTILFTLLIVSVGTVVTCFRRLRLISKKINS